MLTPLPWWAWVMLAGLLALAEMHVPGSYLIWIALGAAATSAIHAAYGVSLEGQLLGFAIAAALSCAAGFFGYRRAGVRYLRGETRLNQRSAALVGERGTVCQAFQGGRGKVRLGDSVWLASGPERAEEGTRVVINAVRGTRLIVAALGPPAAAAAPPQTAPAP
jgi:membrane protein implicated in regulation of membrane protease activity